MKIRLFTIPNSLTLANLLCGSLGVVAALVYNDLRLAFALILAAAVFDFFDGFAARLLKSISEIGVQLDSLADMVSFGFAPAAILFTLFGSSEPHFEIDAELLRYAQYGVFIIPLFSALRLAKFNIDTTQSEEFTGLTTTANAIFISSFAWLVQGRFAMPSEGILLLAVVMAWLLISPIRMFSLKFHNFGWSDNKLRYSFLGVALIALCLEPAYAIPAVIILYIIISTIRWALCSKCTIAK